MQAALYRIAETASTARDMPSFYAAIHEIVGELMYADNFYIALYDDERQRINYPFFVDEVDTDLPDPNAWEVFGIGDAAGVTAHVLRTGRPTYIDAARYEQLLTSGEVQAPSATSLSWRHRSAARQPPTRSCSASAQPAWSRKSLTSNRSVSCRSRA